MTQIYKMVQRKNICILKFNEPTKNGEIIKYIDVKSRTLVINEHFDRTTKIGNATNIIAKKDGLYADLEYLDENKLLSNAYPAIKFDKEYDKIIINSELVGISIGAQKHSQEILENNLNL